MFAPNVPSPSSPHWARSWHSISAKLIVLLTATLIAIFALFGYLTLRLNRQHLDAATLASAERVSDVIKSSTSYSMLHNDRKGLFYLIETIAREPGVVKIRIFNSEGEIRYSTDQTEIDTVVNKNNEACYGCHARTQPFTQLRRLDRFRIYREASGERFLSIVNPIENAPACSNASCHAHSANQKILGVLDTNLSLATADANLAESNRRVIEYLALAVALIAGVSGLFVWRVVHGPLETLKRGTERLSAGELGYQIGIGSRDELGELASSCNAMSQRLLDAQAEIEAATEKLEERVTQKTADLNHAHEEMLRVEKMASIGKLAAVVAHEINNPLTGILTYAKLLKKQFARESGPKLAERLGSLDLIEQESRRCGEIVKNLMTFARSTPMHCEPGDLNAVVKRSVKLVEHQLQLANVDLDLGLEADLSPVCCDAAQIEQVLVSLVVNAIDAMPRGGRLPLRTRAMPNSREAQIEVGDNGVGIPPEIQSKLFEPFFTTKDRGHGLGLGLAISRNIVESHQGKIRVTSEPGRGSLFTITLPRDGAGGGAAAGSRTAV
jgi:two-component system NtrC family sensor kinase